MNAYFLGLAYLASLRWSSIIDIVGQIKRRFKICAAFASSTVMQSSNSYIKKPLADSSATLGRR